LKDESIAYGYISNCSSSRVKGKRTRWYVSRDSYLSRLSV